MTPSSSPTARIERSPAVRVDTGGERAPLFSDSCLVGEPGSSKAPRCRMPRGCRLCGRRRLTVNEAAIARMLAEGLDERQVAVELFVSAVALRAQIAHICAKLDIASPTELRVLVNPRTLFDAASSQPVDSLAECPQLQRINAQLLKPQEVAVYQLTREGLSEREVATELFISVWVVRSHLAHIQAKLGAEGVDLPAAQR